MPLAHALGRILVIVGSAYFAAAGSGAAWVVGLAVRGLIAGDASLGSVVNLQSLAGWVFITGPYFGPIGAIPALVILWRADLRRCVPFTAAVTCAVAAVCGFVLGPAKAFLFLGSPFLTLIAGVLAMMMSSADWPLEHRRRGRMHLNGAPDAIGAGAGG